MTQPAPGDIWRYEYLWRWQHETGETEGRKSRPVALVAVVADGDGKTNLFILPITSTRPSTDRVALEVPQIERRRAGLEDGKLLWVVLDEYNYDVVGHSYYFDPNARIGSFSAAFQQKALRAFLALAKERRLKRVQRR